MSRSNPREASLQMRNAGQGEGGGTNTAYKLLFCPFRSPHAAKARREEKKALTHCAPGKLPLTGDCEGNYCVGSDDRIPEEGGGGRRRRRRRRRGIAFHFSLSLSPRGARPASPFNRLTLACNADPGPMPVEKRNWVAGHWTIARPDTSTGSSISTLQPPHSCDSKNVSTV